MREVPLFAEYQLKRAERLQRLWASGVSSSEIEIMPEEKYERLKMEHKQKGETPVLQLPLLKSPNVVYGDFVLVVADIIEACSWLYKVSADEILGPLKTAKIVRARWVAMYLATKSGRWSNSSIARKMGDRDHTTIMHAREKIKELIAADPELADEVAYLKDCLFIS